MKTLALTVLTTTAFAGLASSATVANWKEFNPNATVVPITGAGTDSPVFGDGTTANSTQSAWIAGQFGTTTTAESVTLAIGQTLTLSGSLTLTGGTNNPAQNRFGIFNSGGQFAADDGGNWAGGWLHTIGGATSDLYQARTDGAFISTGGNAVDLNATATRSGAFDGDSAAPFTFSMSITRDSATTVDITSLVSGGDGNLSEEFVENDITTSLFSYDAAGVLFGGSSGLEQASFSGVQYVVTAVPEPSAGLLGVIGLALGFARRRR
ncbi:MAG: MYXO-CTERM domain-containing protein [Pseudoalteromonas tetraodonis]|jgi:MYXO-CTERM domain-containing protein